MATGSKKRSITVFLTDDEYFAIAARATEHRMNITEYSKSLLTGGAALEGPQAPAHQIGKGGVR